MAYETTYKGEKVFLEVGKYGNGQLAIQMLDEQGLPYTVPTVALMEPLNENELAIKDYSENTGMLDWMMKEGIVGEPVRYVQTGFVQVPICPITDEALAMFM